VERVKELCRIIKETMIKMNKEAGAEYELTASIGYSSYSGVLSGFRDTLIRADKAR